MEHSKKMTQIKSFRLYLFLIILLGIVLRIYTIGNESLWADEGWSFYRGTMSIGALLSDLFFNENNPPVYYVFINIWIKIAGDSEIAIRLPSAIFGIILIYCNFRIGELLYDKTVGLWFSFITAISLFFIEYSQEARVYMLFALLASLSMKSYFELQVNSGVSKYAKYVLWTVLLIYSHVYSVFLVFAQNIIFVFQRFIFQKESNPGLKNWIYLQGTVFLLAFPWFVSYLIRAQDIQDNFWIVEPGLANLKQTFKIYSQNSNIGLLIFLLLSFLAIFEIQRLSSHKKFTDILGWLYSLKWNVKLQKVEQAVYLSIWLFVPIVIPFILSLISQPIYHVKYTIASALPFYLLVGAGAKSISLNRKMGTLFLIAIFLTLSTGKVIGYYEKIKKEQFREAFAYIENNSDPGDLIIMNARAIEWTTYSYYQKRDDLLSVGFPKDSWEVRPEHLPKLTELAEDHSRIWVVLSHSGDKEKLIPAHLKNFYTMVATPSFKGIELFEFRKKP
jgi:mannosyltransferase